MVIHPGVNIKFPWKLRIGDRSWIGQRVWLDNLDMLTIGNNVVISQGAIYHSRQPRLQEGRLPDLQQARGS